MRVINTLQQHNFYYFIFCEILCILGCNTQTEVLSIVYSKQQPVGSDLKNMTSPKNYTTERGEGKEVGQKREAEIERKSYCRSER